MKRLAAALLILCLIPILPAAYAEGLTVAWDLSGLSGGTIGAQVSGAADDHTALLAVYQGELLQRAVTAPVANGCARLTAETEDADTRAKVFVWNTQSLAPAGPPAEVALAEYSQELWVSDNAWEIYASFPGIGESLGYHPIGPYDGGFQLALDVTVKAQGDNRIALLDSQYSNALTGAAATLFFDYDSFYFSGGEAPDAAQRLCFAEVGKPYHITFWGDAAAGKCRVSVTEEGGYTWESPEMGFPQGAMAVDTIALVNYGHYTDLAKEDYRFYAQHFQGRRCGYQPENLVYEGFAGRYSAIRINGKYLRAAEGGLLADVESRDSGLHDLFLPRDMCDGSFALMRKLPIDRITAAPQGQALSASAYDMYTDRQHWILEKADGYTAEAPAYYLKSKYNGTYIGVSDSGRLLSVPEDEKAELVFEPDNAQSPLYRISTKPEWAALTSVQRSAIVRIYETVAGDAFPLVQNNPGKAMFSTRYYIDSYIGNNSRIKEFFTERGYMVGNYYQSADAYSLETDTLPDTQETTVSRQGDSVWGNYYFWSSSGGESNRYGENYTLCISGPNGAVQTMEMYVENSAIARKNARMFQDCIAKIPYILRKRIDYVTICEDDDRFSNAGHRLYLCARYKSVEEQMPNLFHEMFHSIDNIEGRHTPAGIEWSKQREWNWAKNSDAFAMTDYARGNNMEDFAEFAKFYVIAYGNPDRQRALQAAMPGRYRSFRRLCREMLDGYSLWGNEP